MKIINRKALFAFLLSVGLLAITVVFAQNSIAQRHSLDADFSRGDIRFRPNPLRVGKKCEVVVKVKNVGDIRWSGRNFHLVCKVRRCPSGSPRQIDDFTPHVYLKAPVNPNERTEFHYKAVAPSYPGDYELRFTMAEGRTEFGDKVDYKIRVQP